MFLTLPSNNSQDIYPGNVVSDFTTHLPKSIDLEGEWEVALAEIFYPHSWYNVDTQNYWLFYRLGDAYTKAWLSAGYYHSFNEVVDTLKQQLKGPGKPQGLSISFNENTQIVELNVGTIEEELPLQLEVSPSLATLFGIPFTSYRDVETVKGERAVDLNAGMPAIYVYCDIVEPRVVGDTLTSLLDVVPVLGKSGDYVSRRYENLHYHPIKRKSFSEIHLSLRNDRGERVHFRKGKAVVTLHFRRRKLRQI